MRQQYLDPSSKQMRALRSGFIFQYWLTCSKNPDANSIMQQFLLLHQDQCSSQACPCQGITLGCVQDDSSEEGFEDENFHLEHIRSKQVFKVLQHKHCLLQLNSGEIRSLELFIDVEKFGILYASLFRLLTREQDFRGKISRHSFFFLKKRVVDEIVKNERHSGHINFKIDQYLKLQSQFSLYKELIFNETIKVEQFWTIFHKKNFSIEHLLVLGFDIVDKYIALKRLEQDILEENPSFTDILTLNFHFYYEVMNFEFEGSESAEMLKKVQQKAKLEKLNIYFKFNESEMGMVLVKCDKDSLFTIHLANKILTQLLQYKDKHLKRKNIKIVIPRLFHRVHDSFVTNYLTDRSNRNESEIMRHIWILNSHKRIIPVLISVKSFISKSDGLFLGAFFQPEKHESHFRYGQKSNSEITLLANEDGYISAISRNHDKKYKKIGSLIDEDAYFHILDIFPNLTQRDLFNFPAEGMHTEILLNFSLLDQKELKLKKGHLQFQQFNFQGLVKVGELVFTEIKPSFMNLEIVNEDQVVEHQPTRLLCVNSHLQGLELTQQHDGGVEEDFKSNTSSSASGSANFSKQEGVKGELNFNKVPLVILSMQKALLLFFFIITITSFSVLIVSLIEWGKFDGHLQQMELGMSISNSFAKLRLSYSLLMQSANQDYIPYFDQDQDLELLKSGTFSNYQELMDQFTTFIFENRDEGSAVYKYIQEEMYDLVYLNQYGEEEISGYNYGNGVMQYLTKCEKYLNMEKQAFLDEYSHYSWLKVGKSPSIGERDYFFINTNSLKVFYDVSDVVEKHYIEDVESAGYTFQMIIIIICLICIANTIISSLFLIPILWKLDSEQQKNVEQWLRVQGKAKVAVLHQIEGFLTTKLGDEKKKKENIGFQSQVSDLSYENEAEQDQKIELEKEKQQENEIIEEQPVDIFKGNPRLRFQLCVKSVPGSHLNSFTQQEKRNEDQEDHSLYTSYINERSEPFQNNTSSADFMQKSENIDISSKNREEQKLEESKDYLNQVGDRSLDEHLEESEEIGEEEQREKLRELTSIYYKKKSFKVSLLLLYSLVIVFYNVGSFFFQESIYESVTRSFETVEVVHNRMTCISNSLFFILKEFELNQTVHTAFTVPAFDYVHETCGKHEQLYDEMLIETPKELADLKEWLIQMNGKEMCDLVQADLAQKKNYSEGTHSCEEFFHEILKSGLKQAFSSVSYHSLNELTDFESQKNKSREFLKRQYSHSTLEHCLLALEYLIPIMEVLMVTIEDQVEAYISWQQSCFLILFSAFIAFLLASLVLSLKMLIRRLKREVFRTRILVKIIPTEELERINLLLSREEKEKRHKVQEE